jgi:uncharacterized protein with HEPN domain
VRRAVERELEIISEASRHIPADLQEAAPEVPWREIAGIGIVLRHEYQRVADKIVWSGGVTWTRCAMPSCGSWRASPTTPVRLDPE